MTEETGSRVVDEEVRGPRVVVGVDFSTGARAALLFALEDAARRGVPVEAVTSYRPPDYWMDFYAVGTYEPDRVRGGAVDRLRQFVTEVMVEASHGALLLVVGSRGHGGFASMLLGSVSMQCALHASCPVTVVHSPEARHERLHLRRRHERTNGQEHAPVG